jgi:hypothetical protein
MPSDEEKVEKISVKSITDEREYQLELKKTGISRVDEVEMLNSRKPLEGLTW